LLVAIKWNEGSKRKRGSDDWKIAERGTREMKKKNRVDEIPSGLFGIIKERIFFSARATTKLNGFFPLFGTEKHTHAQ